VDHTEASSLGDLIALFYEQFLSLYRDEDLAAVAAAAVINELLSKEAVTTDEFGTAV